MLASYSLAQLVMKPTISRRHATIPTNQHAAQNGGTVRCNPVSLLKSFSIKWPKSWACVLLNSDLKISWAIFRKRSTGNKWVPLGSIKFWRPSRSHLRGTPVKNQHTPNRGLGVATSMYISGTNYPYLSQSDAPIQRTSTTRSFRTSDNF